MRNYNSPFQRTGEISREPRKSADWLEDFAERLALEEKTNQRIKIANKTAVEVSRERQHDQPSIYEMMSAIVSGTKPKYSSVEEAVKDYQERTGLAKWQEQKHNEKIADVAHFIVSNAEGCFDSDDACDDVDDAKKKGKKKSKPEEGKVLDLEEARLRRMLGRGPDDDGPGGSGGASGLSGVLFEMPEDDDYPIAAADDGEKDDEKPHTIASLYDEFMVALAEKKKKSNGRW